MGGGGRTRARRAGDPVEAEFREPCVVTDGSGTNARVTVNRLRVWGVVQVRYELNQPSHSDGSVQRATECSVP
jgi:hypothetical protein